LVQAKKFKNLLEKGLFQEFLENDSRTKIMEPIKVGILVAHGDST
jgi:hypothetical protein